MQARTHAEIGFQELNEFESWEEEAFGPDSEIPMDDELLLDSPLWTDIEYSDHLSIEDLGRLGFRVSL